MAVAADGNYVHIGVGTNGWRTVNVSNPAAPVLAQISAGRTFGLAAAGPLAYAIDGQHQVRVMNVTNLLTPVTTQAFAYLSQSLKVSADGGLVLAAEDEAGLAILNGSPNDINLDGLPDDWEQQIVDADPNDAIRTIWDVRPQDDFDHDGLSNYAEYIAGTSPIDAGSVFLVSSVTPAGGPSGFTVTWRSVVGKTYSVYKSTDLASGFTLLHAGIVASGAATSYTDTSAGQQAFYTVVVTP